MSTSISERFYLQKRTFALKVRLTLVHTYANVNNGRLQIKVHKKVLEYF